MMIQVLCAESLQSAEYIRQSMHKYLQESWVNQPLQSIYILLNFILSLYDMIQNETAVTRNTNIFA